MTLLLREAIGDRLRRVRTTQHRTLRDVSRAARVSLGYLSEVERGRKEASSELLAAICGALELPLAELLREVAGDLGNGHVPPQVIEGGRLVPVAAGDAKAELRITPALSHSLTQPISRASATSQVEVIASTVAAA
jgi:transcriptional regulator with XRE-family HTH domain